MIDELIYLSAGSLVGTIAGLLPGVGVLSSLILCFPFLYGADPLHLLIFYIALAGTVQFTGTIPSVLLSLPGETNSIPALIEGVKFTRHQQPFLAIGICALGSVLGSAVAVLIFLLTTSFIVDTFGIAVNNHFKFWMYLLVIAVLFLAYNNKSIIKNGFLLFFGLFLGLIGESSVTNNFRFTFGITDLNQGLGMLPVISGILIMPMIIKTATMIKFVPTVDKVKFFAPVTLFIRHISSSIRGSIIGMFCGLVPGVSTVLATNVSHTTEKFLYPRHPAKKIIAAESANNSGQFSSLIPLLLLGIPITGSEIFLYNMLTASGWNASLAELSSNVSYTIDQLLPWFLLTNIVALIISWPLARYSTFLFILPKWLIITAVISTLIAVNFYVGTIEYRTVSYILQLLIFFIIGCLLRNWQIIPLIFSFLLASELEGVLYREYIFYANNF